MPVFIWSDFFFISSEVAFISSDVFFIASAVAFFSDSISPLCGIWLCPSIHFAMLHLAILHAGHVLHVMLHFLGAFSVRLGRAQLLLYCQRRFVTCQEIARRFGRCAHLRIGVITRRQWRRS